MTQMCHKTEDKPIYHVPLVSKCAYMLACARPGGYDFENFGAVRAQEKEHGAVMLLIEKMKRKEDFTALERQISDYILEHRDEMFEMSLAQLAGKLYVSKATVIRYFKKLGFSSYRELCVELAREQNYYEASVNESGKILADGSESIQELAARIQKASARALAVTAQYLDYRTVQEMAGMLSRSTRIILCGFSAGGANTADNLRDKLAKFGKDVTVLDYSSASLVRYSSYDRNTAVLFAVYRDPDGRAARIAKEFFDKGLPVLVLSGPYKSDIDRYAYRVLRTHYTDDSDSSTAAKRVAVEFLGDVLYYAVMNTASTGLSRAA